MTIIREKLIDLLEAAPGHANNEVYSFGEIADHLIANGVTFAEDTNVPSKWIPVSEKKPKAGEDVLAVCWWHETWNVRVCYLSVNNPGCWYTSVSGQWTPWVTHWMPLPQPPKEDIGHE